MVSGQKSSGIRTPPGKASVEINVHRIKQGRTSLNYLLGPRLQTSMQTSVDPGSTPWRFHFLKQSGPEESGVGAAHIPTPIPGNKLVCSRSSCLGYCLLRAHSCLLLWRFVITHGSLFTWENTSCPNCPLQPISNEHPTGDTKA